MPPARGASSVDIDEKAAGLRELSETRARASGRGGSPIGFVAPTQAALVAHLVDLGCVRHPRVRDALVATDRARASPRGGSRARPRPRGAAARRSRSGTASTRRRRRCTRPRSRCSRRRSSRARRALDVGAGSGYVCAAMARLSARAAACAASAERGARARGRRARGADVGGGRARGRRVAGDALADGGAACDGVTAYRTVIGRDNGEGGGRTTRSRRRGRGRAARALVARLGPGGRMVVAVAAPPTACRELLLVRKRADGSVNARRPMADAAPLVAAPPAVPLERGTSIPLAKFQARTLMPVGDRGWVS